MTVAATSARFVSGEGAAADAAREQVPCAHCCLPVPRGLLDPDSEHQFCCGGCRTVYETIRRCGLDRYYALRPEDVSTFAGAGPARVTGHDYASFDDAAFRERHVARATDGRAAVDLHVERAHCSACVWLLERLPFVLPGVHAARLDIRRKVLSIEWHEGRLALSEIARRVDALGYPPAAYTPPDVERQRRDADREHLVRLGVAGACAGNAMLIAFALYGGMFNGMDDSHRLLLRGASLLLTVLAVAWPGRVFFTGAIASLRTRVMHMDVPVAIALAAGTAWGAVNTFRGTGEVYFESLTAVVFLLLIGRWIQHRQHRTAHEAVERLYDLTPARARLLDGDGTVREIPVRDLERGALVELRAGDSAPADGILAEGTSSFDLSLLTGESRPVSCAPGDRVHAGTINLDARVVVRVDRTGADTRLGRLGTLIEQLAGDRPPIVRLADRLAHRFVWVVLALAMLTVAAWLAIDPGRAVENAVALLIVTCPCALGLATPLAMVAAIGRAARSGILIKGGAVVERLSSRGPARGLVLLDKTGTLTEGRTSLVRWHGSDATGRLVAILERQAAHPVARAFTAAFGDDDDGRAADDARVTSRGVGGRVDGRTIVVGAPALVREHVTDDEPAWVAVEERACIDAALTPVLVAVDGAVVAVAGFGDPLRTGAREAVAALRREGWTVGMLSGDHPEVVDGVAAHVGIDPRHREGGATPERKVDAVRAARAEHGTVVMVGDGVNDAAALTAADVGIAVSGGAEASLRAADVFLQHPDLAGITGLIKGSRRTVGVIRRNLLASLVYNTITAGLAMTGLINPLIAAALMPLSSLSVVLLSYRSRTFD